MNSFEHDHTTTSTETFHYKTRLNVCTFNQINNPPHPYHLCITVNDQQIVASATSERRLRDTEGYRKSSPNAVSGMIGELIGEQGEFCRIGCTSETNWIKCGIIAAALYNSVPGFFRYFGNHLTWCCIHQMDARILAYQLFMRQIFFVEEFERVQQSLILPSTIFWCHHGPGYITCQPRAHLISAHERHRQMRWESDKWSV